MESPGDKLSSNSKGSVTCELHTWKLMAKRLMGGEWLWMWSVAGLSMAGFLDGLEVGSEELVGVAKMSTNHGLAVQLQKGNLNDGTKGEAIDEETSAEGEMIETADAIEIVIDAGIVIEVLAKMTVTGVGIGVETENKTAIAIDSAIGSSYSSAVCSSRRHGIQDLYLTNRLSFQPSLMQRTTGISRFCS